MRHICYVVDSLAWVQAQRANDLQPYLPDHELHVCLPSFEALSGTWDGIWLASWRTLLAHPELERMIPLDRTMASVTSHYNLGGGLKPAACFRVGADPQEEFAKAIGLLKQFRTVTCNSKILYDLLSPHLPGLLLARHGVDADYFQPPSAGRRPFHPPVRMGWVGKDKGAKNVHPYLDALQRLDGDRFRFNCIIPKKRGGPVKDREGMRAFYWAADFHVCTSWHEGTPNPMLEAAACGLPLLSTPVGNMPEVVREGETGWVIEPTTESVLATIERLQYLEPWEYRRMSEAIRAEIEASWTWERRAEPIRTLLEGLQ